MNLAKAFHDKLSADATLAGLLASYPSGSPSSPAIFTAFPVPVDASRPYIVTSGDVGAASWDHLATITGEDVTRDVYIYADNTGSSATIDTIADRIKSVLHKQSLTIEGHKHVATYRVNGPITAPTDDTLIGRVITFRVIAQET